MQTVALGHNDILLGVTDGVTKARSPSDELYSRARIEQSVKAAAKTSTQKFIQGIKEDLSRFTQYADQADDIAILVLQRS